MGLFASVRDWFYEPRAVRKASSKAAGVDGVNAYAGYIDVGESNAALTGHRKWTTYSDAILEPIVATGVRYFGNLLAGTRWHAEPNEAGGPDAERGVEICEQGLLNAQMTKPWPLVVRKAAMYRLNGFSLHATGVKRLPSSL